MKYAEMTIAEFVKATHTFRQGDKIGTSYIKKDGLPAYAAYAREHKPEILAYLLDEERKEKEAADERQAKIDAIEGLKEIDAAYDALMDYRYKFNRAWESGGDESYPEKPTVDIDALCAKYPRAAAYRKARENAVSANYAKASAYHKAQERILNGEDYEQALADADAEWNAYCKDHIWD